MVRKQGSVKFFDSDRGFGFIEVDGIDYFVHITNVRGEEPLVDGEEVEFKPVKGKNNGSGYEALNVERIDPPDMEEEEGVVERYNDEKGYGFVKRQSKGDVFVHVNDLRDSEEDLEEGAKIRFKVRADQQGRSRAYEIKRIGR